VWFGAFAADVCRWPNAFVRLNGDVRGVLIPPFVHRPANECGPAEFAVNGADSVVIEMVGCGIAGSLARFFADALPRATTDALAVAV
jgi:hypothetical protein